MAYKDGQAVEATTAIPFGKSSKIPRSTRGTVTAVEGTFKKRYAVKWQMPQYGNPVITVDGSYLRGTFSF
jgi:hypothetical protein